MSELHTETQVPDEENTPVEESQRETGQTSTNDTKSSAKPESGSNSDVVAGSPNQGTEKR
jgi:hypothetical protein